MKDKIKIIFLPSFVMTKSRWLNREMNYFEKNSDIEIHELCDFLFPQARKVLEETYKSEKIFTFKKFSNWKNYVLNLQQKCIREGKKLVVLSELAKYPGQGFNLRYVLANRFLKQCQIDFYECHASGLMPADTYQKNYLSYLRYIKIFKYWGYLLLRLNEVLASFFGILLNLKPKGIFISGNFFKKRIENLKIARGIELINFSSWEFSSTLNKKNDVYPSTRKYAVFINRASPKVLPDGQLFNLPYNIHETSEKWYPALDNFLSYLEKIFNLEIIIASHPKSKEEGRIDYLGNRTAVLNRTEELVKGSELVIGVYSTACAYAMAYQKPIFFIYSNETKKDAGTFDAINAISDYFKTKPINIDESVNESQIKSIKNFDEKLYENYRNNFLTSDPKNKNYQIIIEYFNK